MCGIFGFIGSKDSLTSKDPVSVCIEGLKNLEYRGYDSSGIAGIFKGKLAYSKAVGQIIRLEETVIAEQLQLETAIAHTRWATHGRANVLNAHPHFDQEKTLALVHNGIIENYLDLKKQLESEGVVFATETDSEVIAQLIAYHFKKEPDLLKAIRKALNKMKGSFAIAFIHESAPGYIFAACRTCPFVIGYQPTLKEVYISSCPTALREHQLEITFLQDDEIARLSHNQVEIFDAKGATKDISSQILLLEELLISKQGFEHFMLKEIFEQPITIEKALHGRLSEEFGTANFEDLHLDIHQLQSINRVLILGCGTSYHAGLVGASLLENIARIPTEVEIASEYRYSNPIISENTLVIAISQSGETADTLAAVREVKAKGAKILGICNVNHSTLVREADACLFLKAGPEISVCSTKAFTSQLTLLTLFTLFMARLRHLSKEDGQVLIKNLKALPNLIQEILKLSPQIEDLSKKFAHFEHFFFIGRRYMYPTSLEAALKLKEISYVNATGYPAGELKHGPISLISSEVATIVMGGNLQTYDKLMSSTMEIEARQGPLIIFCPEDKVDDMYPISPHILALPLVDDTLASIPYSVAAQLFAYYIAKERGTEIDKPRNLAKSVTVE